jgi:DNA-binding response OmpR family regulator
LATELKPQLVLLDLNLPDFPGAEVLRRLRADQSTASIPVIVISADATPSQIERLLSAGARNYLTKPFSIDMLLAVVDEALAENAVENVPQSAN